MKEAAIVAFLLFAGLQTPIGNVEGVVREPAGAPLRGVLIRLTTVRPGDTRPTTYSVSTDAAGRFRMMAPPATYTVTVQHDGYFGPSLYGIPQPVITSKLSVGSEQTPPILNFTLMPSGTIAGRVSDAANRPAIFVDVAAMQNRYREGTVSLMPVGAATTNERGEYRIVGLAPGEYVVAFNPVLGAVAGPRSPSSDNRQFARTRTFYPGTSDLSKAITLTLEPSDEIRNIDFELQTTEVVTISGSINNTYASSTPGPQSAPSVVPTFTLIPRASSLSSIMSAFPNALSPQARRQGLFEFRGVPAGSYDLYAVVPSINAGEPSLAGHLAIDIESQDLRDIDVPVHPLYELRGQVVEEGGSLPDKTRIRIVPADGRSAAPTEAEVDSRGEVTFKNLQAGRYRLDITLPPNLFLADIRQGQLSRYADNSIQVSDASVEPVQLILGAKASSVDGTVVVSPGESLGDTTVALVPDNSLRGNSILYRTARPEESGRFTLTNISPGTYKIFAWEGVLNTAWLNPEFLAKYEEQGTLLAVGSSSVNGVRVNVIRLQ
jgi:hypothetical protein